MPFAWNPITSQLDITGNTGAGSGYKASVKVGTTANLTATYDNGSSGAGATLTNSGALVALSIDGESLLVNSRVLVKDQSNQIQNGIYTVTVVGDGATAWVLTRSTNYDNGAEVNPGDVVPIEEGTENGNTLWNQTEMVTDVGTDDINFDEFFAPDENTACSNFIVDPSGIKSDYTTFQSAVTAASAGDTITLKEGTYVENVTIDKKLTIVAFGQPTRASNVIIDGTLTISTDATIQGLILQATAENYTLVLTTGVIAIYGCKISSGTTAAINIASGTIRLYNCVNPGGKFIEQTGGTLEIYMCQCVAGTTVSTVSAGELKVNGFESTQPVTTSGTATFSAINSKFTGQLILGGSGTHILDGNYHSTGATTAITVTSAADITNSTIDCSATNAIDGAGTISYGGLTFSGSSSHISTTSQTLLMEGPLRRIGSSNPSNANYLVVQNDDNTDLGSHAFIRAKVGGTSGGDPYFSMAITGSTNYGFGIDKIDADKLKISLGVAESGMGAGTNLWEMTTAGDATYTSTGYLKIQTGTTAQRPGTPAEGMIRGNTDLTCLEYYNGTSWGCLATKGLVKWTDVTGTSQSLAVNNGYQANNASLVTLTLPTTADVGDLIEVVGIGAGGWKIAQNASQIINVGSAPTTTGTSGSLASTNQYDAITLRCVVANTTFVTTSVVGTVTVV